LHPITRELSADAIAYAFVRVDIDRTGRRATVLLKGPPEPPPSATAEIVRQGADFYPLRLARELDDAILHLRLNEIDIGTIIFKSAGDPAGVLAYDTLLASHADHWLVREIIGQWRLVLKRIDVTSRSLVALIEPGSCFAGTLAEIAFASDRAYMLDGAVKGDNRPAATLMLGAFNFGTYPMANDLSRLATRFLGEPQSVDAAQNAIGQPLEGWQAADLGIVTEAFDEIDWDDEVRIFLEERTSFSADGLTGLEANLRFAGPETMETKIFGRLSAWQNWIFQRANAVGPDGALKRYGTGVKAKFDPGRV
jgi:benzoyl-CoA-dihydrodiol lyase